MFISLNRIIKSGIKNFFRKNGLTFATVFILVITISLITGLFLFRKTTNSLVLSLQERVDISVYFKKESQEPEILAVKESLERLPEVKTVEYISKADALEKFTQRYRDNPLIMESLAEVGDNPLLAHLNIKAWQAFQYEAVANFLENSYYKDSINKVAYYQRKSAIDKLFSLTSNINTIGIVSIILFAFLAVLVSFNTIRLAIYNSKEEISIQRLVGASNRFIKGPFVVQGILVGVTAGLISALIFVPGLAIIGPKLETISASLNLFTYIKENLVIVILIQLLTGVILGVFSSLIAMRKYLRV